MNIKKILVAVFALSTTIAFAQEQRIKEESKTIFKPHWFIQAQIGAAHTVGEGEFTDLISPAAAVNVGYKFAPAFGARLGVSGWQAKAGWVTPSQTYQYKYLQGNLDLMADLSTLFCGFNPKRVFNGYIFGGVGLNHAFDNDEANALDTRSHELEYLWQDKQNLVAGRMGLGCDLRLNDRLAINIEGNANVLSDKFNSKKAGNCDWQFNVLAGFSCRLNKKHRKVEAPREIIFEETVPVVTKEEPVSQPVLQETKQDLIDSAALTARQDIFFALNSSVILASETAKIDSLVAFMKTHTETQVVITGYADVQTGNPRYNKVLSQRRAEQVAVLLTVNGISRERITVFAKGDTEQPFPVMEQNRVAICLIGKK